MNILVSSCLLVLNCRYTGDSCYSENIAELSKDHTLIPVCPEQMGGLPTPRNPLERVGARVTDKEGRNYTAEMEKGAEEALKIARLSGCTHAIMKSRSPSCGCGIIHDGTFSGHLITGNGVTVEKLLNAGINIVDEHHLSQFHLESD